MSNLTPYIILGLAVTLGQVSGALGTAAYVVQTTADAIQPMLLPAMFLAINMAVAFSIGSSWGTYAVVFPIAMPLAFAINPDPQYERVVQWVPLDQGPESAALEMIRLPFWYDGPQYNDLDSGFGPYAPRFGVAPRGYRLGPVAGLPVDLLRQQPRPRQPVATRRHPRRDHPCRLEASKLAPEVQATARRPLPGRGHRLPVQRRRVDAAPGVHDRVGVRAVPDRLSAGPGESPVLLLPLHAIDQLPGPLDARSAAATALVGCNHPGHGP
jgi:hypothetical protein